MTRNVTRDVNRRYVHHNGRRGHWRNGVWVVSRLPEQGYVASCAYEYNRWQSTGSSYWRVTATINAPTRKLCEAGPKWGRLFANRTTALRPHRHRHQRAR